ncbi:MAG: T9SS type A sorting domain-containing protein, partial [Bacteroidetes bacterium]|nr:T9SS type A sorting domain-containing protein [Bacteroidota bacterium]
YAAISQLTFDIETKNAIYTANSSIYTKGTDPMSLNNDNIFSDGYQYQMATLTANSTTGGYDAYMEVTVQGVGTMGISNLEKETAKNFTLSQNYPNPYTDKTTIPFNLTYPSEVSLEIWDLSGKRVATINQGRQMQGEHDIKVNMSELGLTTSTYVYQLQVINQNGTWRSAKVMTAGK